MRKKLNDTEKRNKYIGIKVQQKTREQLEYISQREQTPVSTLIDEILKKHIENYFHIAKINWDELSPQEKGG